MILNSTLVINTILKNQENPTTINDLQKSQKQPFEESEKQIF